MWNTSYSRLNASGSASEFAVGEIVSHRVAREWCLFLDRDGVINQQIVGDYVRSWRDFVWLPGAKSAIGALRKWAPRIVVVTNQQGIGKGLMSVDDVSLIHHHLQEDLAADDVELDAFQVCPHLVSDECPCRKPRAGLVLDWLAHNADIEGALSVVVGDSESDIKLAHEVATATGGCASIQIGVRSDAAAKADASFDSLWDFAVAVEHVRRGFI